MKNFNIDIKNEADGSATIEIESDQETLVKFARYGMLCALREELAKFQAEQDKIEASVKEAEKKLKKSKKKIPKEKPWKPVYKTEKNKNKKGS